MEINKATLNLIKEFEGLYLRSYRDAVGVWTIGYGITSSDKNITGKTIKGGMKISKETAEEWLIRSLEEKYAPKVLKYQNKYHFNENQFGALVSFAFNIGSIDGLTANGTRSIPTIRKKMLEYCKAGGRVLKGLERRRKAELKLFDTPVVPKEPQPYSGTLPAFEKRDYYKKWDGIVTLRNYKTQIERVQRCLNWAIGANLTVDGKYGKKTEDAVRRFQTKYGFNDVNGCWGKKCNAKMKTLKR